MAGPFLRSELRDILQGTIASGRKLERDIAVKASQVGLHPKVTRQMRQGMVPATIEFNRPIVPVSKGLLIRLETDLYLKVTSEPFKDRLVVKAKGILVDYRAETLLRRSPPASGPGLRSGKKHRTMPRKKPRNPPKHPRKRKLRGPKPPTAEEIARAGHDSAYTDQIALAVPGEQEHPPDRWYDSGAATRKVEQMDSRKELQPEVAARQHLKLVKAQLSEVSMRMVNSGQDPEEMLNEISAKLDRKRNELDAAA